MSYVFWGGMTTLVSFAAYGIATRVLCLGVVSATIVSWIVAVLFAFVTNKLWVFGSKSLAPLLVLRELVAFVASRLTSGGIELFMMWLFADVFGVNDWLMKLVANVVVIIANYVFSKIFVFRK
ncbi:MAG: GtrA family protein [Candidatus Spyradosoma sp.]